MKKFLFVACLFSGLISYGASQEKADGTVIFHESFDIRNDANDLPSNDPNGRPQDDPNFYKHVKDRWSMLNYDGNAYTFEGDPGRVTDAAGETVYFQPDEGTYHTAGCLVDWASTLYVSYADDWLIMKNPIKVKGDFHVTFYSRTYGSALPVEIWYGTTEKPDFSTHNASSEEITAKDPNWKCMGKVFIQEEFEQEWQKRISSVANTGVDDSVPVYIAIRLNLPKLEVSENYFRIDELSVISGNPTGLVPDVKLSNVILPEGGCELTEAPIVLDVVNNSDFATKGLICNVVVYRDDEEVETISDTLPDFEMLSGESTRVTFNKKIKFEQNGVYEVVVTVSLPADNGTETELTNNRMSAFVEKHNGLPVPVEFAFFGTPSTDENAYAGEDAASYWNFEEGTWRWNGSAFEAKEDESPLKSTCIALEKDKVYSFKWRFMAGYKYPYGGRIFEETYAWFVGPSGSEFSLQSSEWKQIKKETVFVDTDKESNFTFECDATGEYQFVLYIYPNPDASNSVYDLRFNCSYVYLSEAGSDYGLDEFVFPMMAYKTPLSMMKGKHATKATVANYGVGEPKAKVNIYLGERSGANLIGSSDEFTLKVGEKKDIEFNIDIAEEKLADFSMENKNKFIAAVELTEEEDSYTANDEANYEMRVTDTVLSFVANDNPAEYYTYFYNKGGLGALLELTEQDTLTQIAVSFDGTNAGSGSKANYDVVVRSVVEEAENGKYVLGATYFRNRYERGDQKKVYTHDINPLVLAPGKYVVGVIQPTATDYLFIHIDNVIGKEAKGVAFSVDESIVQTQQAVGNYVGNPFIDVVFGHNSVGASAVDVAVSDIIRPVDMGVFSANEPVKAKVENIGAEALKDLVVYCKVDDQVYEKTIESLAIGASTEVEFTVNLSQVGERKLSVYTHAEGDKNSSNDTISMVVNSMAPENPTKFDFENCADFAYTNFNPQWKTVDGDGASGWVYDLDYVGSFAPGAPVGVFVLNTFTAQGGLVESISAHSGDKLGFSPAPSSSDVMGEDWLISPALEIQEGAQISFWTNQYTGGSTLSASSIELYVSEKSDNIDDLNEGWINAANNAGMDEWMQTTFDLQECAGKTVYLGLKISQGSASLLTMIDDIEVTNAVVGNQCDYAGNVEVSVYPNPATTQVNISAAATISSIEVMSMTGAVVYRDANVNSNEYRLNVEKLVPGVYFIHMNSVQGTAVAKIVVK